MNEIAKNDNHPAVHKPDPREVIDSKMKTKICGLLALGYSQNMAAEHLGCDSGTITRTAKRDPKFHEQLVEARSDASIEALRLIRHTGSQERYWRAAAWMLERRHPDEYGRRAPNTFTGEQMMKVLDRVLEVFMPAVPPERVAEVMSEFEEEFCDVAEKARLPLPEFEPEEEDGEESPETAECIEPPRESKNGTAPPAAVSPHADPTAAGSTRARAKPLRFARAGGHPARRSAAAGDGCHSRGERQAILMSRTVCGKEAKGGYGGRQATSVA